MVTYGGPFIVLDHQLAPLVLFVADHTPSRRPTTVQQTPPRLLDLSTPAPRCAQTLWQQFGQ